MSADFTEKSGVEAREPFALGFARAFTAVGGLALACQWALPVSSWFRSLACLMAFACYLLLSPVSRESGGCAGRLLAPGLMSVVYLCLLVRTPAARLALLAWVFTSEFWVERSPGGKRRGRGGLAFMLGLASLGWAAIAGYCAMCPGMWFVRRRLCGLLMLAQPTALKAAGSETGAIAVLALLLALVSRHARPGGRMARLLAAACVLLTILCVLQPLAGGMRYARAGGCPRRRRPGSVALYSKGLLDWEVPSSERLGLVRSGMFGLFRKSLERHAASGGGEVVDVDSLGPGTLSPIGLIVFINPTRRLTPAEGGRLADFVAAGGGLLVLGDHTDIGGSLVPLNSVIEFTSLKLNFDSAMALRPRWAGCLEFRRHPVTAGVRDEVDAQIGIGASLDIAPPAFPIVTGRYAFSDLGNYENGGRGANMGNGTYDYGEAVGDIVLVAGEEVGNGRVLVFGDTSPFQNGARFLSQRLVANSIHWVCGRDLECTGAGAAAIRPFDDVASIDFGRCPQAARELFTKMSLGGLANCIFRAGMTPVPAYDDIVPRAALAFLVAPTRRLGHRSTRRLMQYMQSGGALIIAKGYAAPEPCAHLFAGLGFAIAPVPLGNGDAAGPIRHKNAWEIEYTGAPDTVVHASAFGRPTAVTKPVGEGSFTLIGDGEVLLDANLEGETGAIPENVEFVAALLRRLRKEKCGLAPKDGVLAGDLTD